MKLELIEGILVKREKRFLATVALSDKREVIAHCANPGSMRGNAVAGMKVWLQDIGSDHLERGKKLRYKWIFVDSKGVRVCVDTSMGNRLVQEALLTKKIPELAAYDSVRAEATLGDSRYDFLLQSPGKADCYVEVKSVSMGIDKAGRFPDSVTLRGQKHLRGLQEIKKSGKRAVLFFLLMRCGGLSVSPAHEIDLEYARLLRESVELGVEVLVYNIDFQNGELCVLEKGSLIFS